MMQRKQCSTVFPERVLIQLLLKNVCLVHSIEKLSVEWLRKPGVSFSYFLRLVCSVMFYLVLNLLRCNRFAFF